MIFHQAKENIIREKDPTREKEAPNDQEDDQEEDQEDEENAVDPIDVVELELLPTKNAPNERKVTIKISLLILKNNKK